eukprot:6523533-Prymnesium_polylepis.4
MANLLFGCCFAALTNSTRLMNVLCFILFIGGVILSIIVGVLGTIDLSAGASGGAQVNALIDAIMNPVTIPPGLAALIQIAFPPLGLSIVISDVLLVVRSVAAISENGQVEITTNGTFSWDDLFAGNYTGYHDESITPCAVRGLRLEPGGRIRIR